MRNPEHYSMKGGHKERSDWHKELPVVQKRVGLVSKGDIYMSKFLMRRIGKTGKS